MRSSYLGIHSVIFISELDLFFTLQFWCKWAGPRKVSTSYISNRSASQERASVRACDSSKTPTASTDHLTTLGQSRIHNSHYMTVTTKASSIISFSEL